MACRDLPPMEGRGPEEPVSRAVRVRKGSWEDEEEEQGLSPAAAGARPRVGVRQRLGELPPGGCRAGGPGWSVTGRGGRP